MSLIEKARRFANSNQSEILQRDDYVRERLYPRPGDADYLHLSDLRLALEDIKEDVLLRVLDYGCGGSPYRLLFPNADYRRADYSGFENLNYVIAADSNVTEANETFDLILSTQVIEHVINVRAYFAECYRLLKPGGKVVCTTHGSYIDHGCPDDYQRWTAGGLRRDLESAGFMVRRIVKLTTGPRALMYFADRFNDWLCVQRTSGFALALWVLRSLIRRFRRQIHARCDRMFAAHRVVMDDLHEHPFYVNILAIAVKPDVLGGI